MIGIALIFLNLTLAQETQGPAPVSKGKGEARPQAASEFKEYKEECPHNSKCRPKAMQKYQLWSKLLAQAKGAKDLERLNQQIGVPLKVWSMADKEDLLKGPAGERLLLWDSGHQGHATHDPVIGLGLLFTQRFDYQSWNAKKVYLDKAYLLRPKGKKQTIQIPRGEIPQYVKGLESYFVGELDNQYFYYSINAQNQVKLLPGLQKSNEALKSPCSAQMLEFIKEDPTAWGHYPTCRLLWDQQSKSYVEFALSWVR